jgi:hypothetical protein
MNDAGVNKKNYYSKNADLSQKISCGPYDGNISAVDEKFVGFV